MHRRQWTMAALSASVLIGAAAGTPVVLAATAAGVVSTYDSDKDDTLDLAEVKTAAGAHFDRINKDADSTLEVKEVKGLIGAKQFKQADPDNDGSLSKDEYLSLVESLFKKADTDHDGTLSVKELRSKAALQLRRLID